MRKTAIYIVLILIVIFCVPATVMADEEKQEFTKNDESVSEEINSDSETETIQDEEEYNEPEEEVQEEVVEKEKNPFDEPAVPKVTIADGEYEIRAKGYQKSIFDVDLASSRLQLWQDADVENQRFYITHIGNGYYKITLRKTQKAIDVCGAAKTNGAIVQQYTYNGSDAQKWIIKDNGNGYYSFVSKCNSLYMTVTNKNASNGSKVCMNQYNGQYIQEFELNKIHKDTGKCTIANGEYEIRSAIDNSRIFDIDTGSKPQGAKLQLWKDNDVTQQRFYIYYLGNGYYKILSRRSGKGLDVVNAGIKNGTRVQQYDYYGGSAQQWIIKDAGDGYYNIISRCNGYYMTASNGRDGTSIQMYEDNGGVSQKFILDKVLKDTGKQSIEDGEYEIRSAVDRTRIFDIDTGSNPQGAKLQLWKDNDVTQQRFYVSYKGNGYYKITVRRSGKSIDVSGAGIYDGVRVQQYDYNGSEAQSWIIKDTGDGTYNIISQCNGYYMTASSAKDGTSILMCHSNGSTNQKFIFDKVLKDKPKKSIENGEYEIRSAIDGKRVFDIDTGSNPQGAKLQLWYDNDVTQQRFNITYLGNGYYKMLVKRSGKAIDVAGAGIQNGTRTQQYDYNGSDAQQWIIKDAGDGYYNIISKCNGYYMTANSGKDGTPVLMYEQNGKDTQKFQLERVTDKIGIDVSAWNGTINWAQVKSAGVEFAFIRLGYRGYESGKVVSDTKYEYNIKNAINNNINVGVYFYSQATTVDEAIEEANYCIKHVKGYNISYPIVFDSEFVNSAREGRADWLSKDERTKICKAFCDTIKKNGYTPMIYASKSWFYNELNFSELSSYKIWVAHYTYDPAKKTDFKYPYEVWQYTSTGRIPGINGNVDIDIRYLK